MENSVGILSKFGDMFSYFLLILFEVMSIGYINLLVMFMSR